MGQRILAVGTLIALNVVLFLFLGLLAIVSLIASIPFAMALFRL